MNDDQTAGGGTFIPLAADYAQNPELAADPAKWIYGAPRAPHKLPNGDLAARWKPAARTVVMRTKGYLVDAAFVVGLTGPAEVIDCVAEGLRRPRRLPFLGRRNCPLAAPPLWGVTRDAQWQITAPLLHNATDFRPRFWHETPPVADSVGYPEQPDGVITRRRVVHLRWTRLPALLVPVEIGAPL